MPTTDLLLLAPALAVIALGVGVWRRERPAPEARPEEPDVIVDLTFLRTERPEDERPIAALSGSSTGTLGARLRTAQLAEQESHRPVVRARRRRTRPLVASR